MLHILMFLVPYIVANVVLLASLSVKRQQLEKKNKYFLLFYHNTHTDFTW